MRKILVFISVVLISFAILLVFFIKNADYLVSKASHKILQVLETRQQITPGLKIKDLNFTDAKFKSGAKFKSINAIVWSEVSCQLFLNGKSKPHLNNNLIVQMENLSVELKSFSKRKFVLIAEGLTVETLNDTESTTQIADKFPKRIKDGELRMVFTLDFLKINSIKAQIIDQVKKVSTIFKNGRTEVPIDFSGISFFHIKNKQVKAKITTQQEGRYFSLVVNKEFFIIISRLLKEDLTKSDIEILSKNPFRVTKLLEIRDIARKDAKDQYEKNNKYPEDAYRHVLWSYLLTREYGQEFAKKVTDAHEKGDGDNTTAENQMDYNNNAIGRQYAARGFKISEILYRVLQDPKVIRSPR